MKMGWDLAWSKGMEMVRWRMVDGRWYWFRSVAAHFVLCVGSCQWLCVIYASLFIDARHCIVSPKSRLSAAGGDGQKEPVFWHVGLSVAWSTMAFFPK